MKTLLHFAFLLLPLGTFAQQEVAPVPDRMKLAGELIEKDGKKRTLGLTIALGSLFVGGLIVAQSDGEDAPVAAGTAFIGIGAVTSIVLNFGAAKQAKKAGRMMQGL